jgi:hypothetical protein
MRDCQSKIQNLKSKIAIVTSREFLQMRSLLRLVTVVTVALGITVRQAVRPVRGVMLDFLLREYFGLAVPFYFHAWCIPDPIPESLPHLLHCCIGRGDFLTWQ